MNLLMIKEDQRLFTRVTGEMIRMESNFLTPTPSRGMTINGAALATISTAPDARKYPKVVGMPMASTRAVTQMVIPRNAVSPPAIKTLLSVKVLVGGAIQTVVPDRIPTTAPVVDQDRILAMGPMMIPVPAVDRVAGQAPIPVAGRVADQVPIPGGLMMVAVMKSLTATSQLNRVMVFLSANAEVLD